MIRTLAFIIICSTAIVSCKKKQYQLGSDVIDSNTILGGTSIDTFSLVTYTIEEDSIISDNPSNVVLGSYIDPVFGSYNASFFTQLRLAGVDPNFGDPNTIVIDSFVLALEYVGNYGDLDPQTFEAYELEESMSLDSTYYSFSTLAYNALNLVPLDNATISPNTSSPSVVGGDSLAPQLRIHLDTLLARSLITEATSGGTTFSSNDEFLEFFKGLYLRTNNLAQVSGEGAALYLNINDPSSKATIYFQQDGEPTSYDLIINSDCADFTKIAIDQTGTNVEAVIQDSTVGQNTYYAQAFGTRAALSFPGILSLPENIVIHRADLSLPVQFQTGYKYQPGTNISVATRADSSSTNLVNIGVFGVYNPAEKQFNINIREYVQSIVNKDLPLTELVVSPLYFINSAERIVFNGSNTINKTKPKLTITYTTY
ncbi:MAG: DUF4270 family protein [Crocinitomicaceae bacterium]|jgi:hypothetical protein|tara:strand:+ start:1569 stop:2849 length:1281 start_codon:yes stop_codon:yes gene_type:complete